MRLEKDVHYYLIKLQKGEKISEGKKDMARRLCIEKDIPKGYTFCLKLLQNDSSQVSKGF